MAPRAPAEATRAYAGSFWTEAAFLGAPDTFEGMPAPFEDIPAPFEGMPASIQGIPAPIEDIPASIQGMPAPMACTRAKSRGAPAEAIGVRKQVASTRASRRERVSKNMARASVSLGNAEPAVGGDPEKPRFFGAGGRVPSRRWKGKSVSRYLLLTL